MLGQNYYRNFLLIKKGSRYFYMSKIQIKYIKLDNVGKLYKNVKIIFAESFMFLIYTISNQVIRPLSRQRKLNCDGNLLFQ